MLKSSPNLLHTKIASFFIILFACAFLMLIGKDILLPIIYATIIAVLLNPLVNYFVKIKINRLVAIFIAVTLALVVVVTVLYIVLVQISSFSDSLPAFKQKFNLLITDSIYWVSETFNINIAAIHKWIAETEQEEISNFQIGEKLTSISKLLVTILLLPVYMTLILYYKPLFLDFMLKVFNIKHHNTISEILTNAKGIIQSYLVGLFFEIIIIAILNTAGLLLLDIKYAFLLGIMSAFLNVIPYLGGIIGAGVFMIIALVTKTPVYMLYVLILYSVIQFVDNNFIVPRIVASRVQINAFISVIVVLIGGALWGIAGMFLSIPLTAIVKVVFDHIDSLKPWGFLLGNTIPTKTIFSRLVSNKKK